MLFVSEVCPVRPASIDIFIELHCRELMEDGLRVRIHISRAHIYGCTYTRDKKEVQKVNANMFFARNVVQKGNLRCSLIYDFMFFPRI